jgi:hypothetical protein
MADLEVIGLLTPDEVVALKQKHNLQEVFQLTVEDPEDDNVRHVGYFKKPDLDVVSMAATAMQKDMMAGGRIITKNCWLAGSEKAKNDNGELKASFMAAAQSLFKIKEAEVKKL